MRKSGMGGSKERCRDQRNALRWQDLSGESGVSMNGEVKRGSERGRINDGNGKWMPSPWAEL